MAEPNLNISSCFLFQTQKPKSFLLGENYCCAVYYFVTQIKIRHQDKEREQN